MIHLDTQLRNVNDIIALLASLPDWLKTYQPHLAAIASMIAIIGVPIAVGVFIWEKRRERLDREYGTCISVSNRYIDFLKICFENPHLDIYEIATDEDLKQFPSSKKPEDIKKELLLYTILITMCEQAYLIYLDHSSKTRARQWSG